jgi:ABC-type Na+ transport system ATPase subunit NatA
MPPSIETEELTKDFAVGFWRTRTYRALDRLSLVVEPGEVFGFLGPNGAGKTTTLKLLMQLIHPTAGHARILGRPVGDLEVRRRIGFLPENPYFYDYLTAEELLVYFASLFGFDPAERRARASRLLDEVGIGAERRLQLRTFSKGMIQRVGIAQALVNDPEVVFLDEPMSGLDPLGRRDMRALILSASGPGLHGVLQLAHPARRRGALQSRRDPRPRPAVGERPPDRPARLEHQGLGSGRRRGHGGDAAAVHLEGGPHDGARWAAVHDRAVEGGGCRGNGRRARRRRRPRNLADAAPYDPGGAVRAARLGRAGPRGGGAAVSLPTIRRVALAAFRESVRDRVLYSLVGFALLVIGASVLVGQLTAGQDVKIIKDLGLAAMSLFGVFIAIFIGIGLVAKEVERRSVYSHPFEAGAAIGARNREVRGPGARDAGRQPRSDGRSAVSRAGLARPH